MHFSNVRGTSGTNGLTSHLSTSVLGGETAIIVQSVARSLSFEPALVDDGNRPAKMGGPAEPCSPRTPPLCFTRIPFITLRTTRRRV